MSESKLNPRSQSDQQDCACQDLTAIVYGLPEGLNLGNTIKLGSVVAL